MVFRLALPGYHYEFPRDHFNHPEYQTEWWYYTGNLHAADGRRFGFELTFFRQGVDRAEKPSSIWDVGDIWMAHLALSDIDGHHFFHTQRLNRSGPGLAGADLSQTRVWNGNWQAQWKDNSQELRAVADQFSVELSLKSEKAPVIHGQDGVSQKAEGAGRASHYISLTRLDTRGTVTLEGKQFSVEGLSWMDHEFFTHQLEPGQAGWDWFSLQLDDGSEIMLFQIRRTDGLRDRFSAGTFIDRSGRTTHLSMNDFSLTPGEIWTSPETGGRYPIHWTIRVPRLGFESQVTTPLPQQELAEKNEASPAYWEGAIRVTGMVKSKPVQGVGYLEMTGYAGKPPLL
jgi:predicted secreted hydrolase